MVVEKQLMQDVQDKDQVLWGLRGRSGSSLSRARLHVFPVHDYLWLPNHFAMFSYCMFVVRLPIVSPVDRDGFDLVSDGATFLLPLPCNLFRARSLDL